MGHERDPGHEQNNEGGDGDPGEPLLQCYRCHCGWRGEQQPYENEGPYPQHIDGTVAALIRTALAILEHAIDTSNMVIDIPLHAV